MSEKELLIQVQDKFIARIMEKNSWGKNEVIECWKRNTGRNMIKHGIWEKCGKLEMRGQKLGIKRTETIVGP